MSDALATGLATHRNKMRPYPPPFKTGLVGWWDAADLSTITESGGKVSQFDDKSGLGNHLVQGTGANQPSTGLVTRNSLNTLYFAGGNNAVGSWIRKLGFNQTSAQEFFVVFQPYSTQPLGGIAGLWSADNDRGNVRASAAGLRFRYNNDVVIPGAPGDKNELGHQTGEWNPNGTIGSVVTDLDIANDVWSRVHMTRGNPDSGGSVYTTFRLGGDKVAGGRHLRFDFAELLIYNQTLTTAERAETDLYLRLKWAL